MTRKHKNRHRPHHETPSPKELSGDNLFGLDVPQEPTNTKIEKVEAAIQEAKPLVTEPTSEVSYKEEQKESKSKSDIVDVHDGDNVDVEMEELPTLTDSQKENPVDYYNDILVMMEGTRGATPKWLAKKSKIQMKKVEHYLKTGKGLEKSDELLLYLNLLAKIKQEVEFEKKRAQRQQTLLKNKKFIMKLKKEGKLDEPAKHSEQH